MMKVETYACDICGTLKKEANHWWKAHISPEGRGVLVSAADGQLRAISHPSTEQWHAVADLCGEQCVVKYISKNLFGNQEANR